MTYSYQPISVLYVQEERPSLQWRDYESHSFHLSLFRFNMTDRLVLTYFTIYWKFESRWYPNVHRNYKDLTYTRSTSRYILLYIFFLRSFSFSFFLFAFFFFSFSIKIFTRLYSGIINIGISFKFRSYFRNSQVAHLLLIFKRS